MVKISSLPQTGTLTGDELVPLVQNEITQNTPLEVISEFIGGPLEASKATKAALQAEFDGRVAADAEIYDTVAEANAAQDAATAADIARERDARLTRDITTRVPPTPVGEMPRYALNSGVSVLNDTRNVLYLIIVVGQSNASGATGGAVVASASLFPGRSLMPGSGSVQMSAGNRFATLIPAFEAQAGNTYESICTSMLDHLAAMFNAVSADPVFATMNAGIGGQPYSNLKRGSQAYQHFLRGVQDYCVAAAAMGRRIVVPAIVSVQGENETDLGVTRSQFRATRAQWVRDMNEDIAKITLQTERALMFVGQVSVVNASYGIDQPIQMALYDAGDMADIRLVQPYYNYPRVSGETIHMTSIGQNRFAQPFARAIFAEMYGVGWRPLSIRQGYFTSSTVIRLECEVPVAPIVIDTSGDVTATGLRGLYGFDVQKADGSYVSPSAVAPGADARSLTLTLPSAPGGPFVKVAYAMRRNSDGNTDDGPVLGARGCVRDSESHANLFQTYTSRNWLCHWVGIIPNTGAA